MPWAADMNAIGRRSHDRAAAARGALLSCAVLTALGLTGGVQAQTPDQTPAGPAPASPNFANGNPATAQKAMQDAIPLTPEMIEELGRRFNATQRAREEAVTPLAVPLNRQINVSFAPGAATSIVNTVKGYPTAVSFFDSTGQPWPILAAGRGWSRRRAAVTTIAPRPACSVTSAATSSGRASTRKRLWSGCRR